jgi:hypothetical protein
MKIFDLIIEQIKSEYPESRVHDEVSNNLRSLTLEIPPFGSITINNNLNVHIKYIDPYDNDFEIIKSFFDSRLSFEGSATYFMENEIHIYKRSLSTSNDFELAIKRAKVFLKSAVAMEKYIEWNEKLKSK